ncbi:unnamed protein product, partial [marine sediment metagenome]
MKKSTLIGFSILSVFLLCSLSYNPIIAEKPVIELKEDVISIENEDALNVQIKIQQNTTIYEGDIISCNITGDPTSIYWRINNQDIHQTFYNNNPIIFDP